MVVEYKPFFDTAKSVFTQIFAGLKQSECILENAEYITAIFLNLVADNKVKQYGHFINSSINKSKS